MEISWELNQTNYSQKHEVWVVQTLCTVYLARSKIGARGLSEISRIYGTVRLGNVFSLVRTVGMVGWYGWYGWLVRLVRLVRLVPFVGTLEPYQPYPETVPMNRTTVPYQIKGGVKGGAFWMYQY